MTTNLFAFLVSALYVVFAEMGDKSQLLAMAFATKYSVSKVLLGISVAAILNHGLAVWIANVLIKIPSAQIWIQAVASLSFIFFGLLTLKNEKLDESEGKFSKFGPFLTVAITFFIGEFGDKTQITTFGLATRFQHAPLGVLIGAIVGMLIADSIAIALGVIMCKRMPEKTIKLISSSAFIIFGFIGCWEILFNSLRFGTIVSVTIMSVLVILTMVPAYLLFKNIKNDATELKYCRPKNLDYEK